LSKSAVFRHAQYLVLGRLHLWVVAPIDIGVNDHLPANEFLAYALSYRFDNTCTIRTKHSAISDIGISALKTPKVSVIKRSCLYTDQSLSCFRNRFNHIYNL